MMDTGSSPDVFRFEQFRFDPRSGSLSRRNENGEFQPVSLGSRAIAVLGVLVGRAGDLVPKDEIMRAVWPGTAVEEANLTMHISALRRVLDAGRTGKSCILNVPGRGYRFLPEIRVGANPRLGAIGEMVTLPEKPSIAVLAFTNMSGDPEQEYFSDGVTGSIITALSRSRWLFVVARNSSFTYKGRAVDVRQVSQQLGVRYVLEGSIQRADDRVRVHVQLIDAETGTHIWANSYDRHLADVFVVQDDITEAVSRAIGAAITRAEQQRALRKPSENLDAWEAYQRALWHHSKGGPSDVERARHFLERAITLDPLFAAAYAMLAFTRIYDGNLGAPFALPDGLAKAKAEARTAIECDPEEPSALVAMAWVAWSEGDHVTAVQSAEQAISVDPNHAGAYLVKGMALAYSGKTSEGREAGIVAIRLSPRDPMSAIMRLLLIVSHYFERDYVNALATARSAIRDYAEYPSPYRYVAASLGQLGHARDANEALQQAMDVAPADFDRYVGSRRPWFRPEDYEHVLDGLRKAGWHG